MKKILFILALAFCLSAQGSTNVQLFYDFGSTWSTCPNKRTKRVTMTLEHLSFDKWGSNFFFVDLDFGVNKNDPNYSPFGAYTEIARTLNFWGQSKVKDLSLHIEYNGGLGLFNGGGFSINHAALAGIEYFLHTPNYNNTFVLQLLYRYQHKLEVTLPMQFTFVWTMHNLLTAKGLTFSGYIDFYDGGKKFALTTEPQIWYAVGQWFNCDNLNIGTEIEMSYNFCGAGFMCNPCIGLKWIFE